MSLANDPQTGTVHLRKFIGKLRMHGNLAAVIDRRPTGGRDELGFDAHAVGVYIVVGHFYPISIDLLAPEPPQATVRYRSYGKTDALPLIALAEEQLEEMAESIQRDRARGGLFDNQLADSLSKQP